MLYTYIVRFTVNGKTLETSITAANATDAKKSVQMQYTGQKVTIVNCKNLETGRYG